MRYYTVEKLGPKQSVTPEGFLLCLDVPIARTGFQTYHSSEMEEVEPGPDDLIIVERTDEEVFREETVASAAGKPVTVRHPPRPEEDGAWTVDPENWKEFSRGVCCSPRRSTEDPTLLVADLLVCDSDAIDKIRSGELTEISSGYATKVVQLARGKGKQTNILINHIALVEQGRCGPRCAIHDHRPKGITMKKTWKDIKKAIRDAVGKNDTAALNQTLDSVCDEAPVEPEGSGDIHSRLKKVEDAMSGYGQKLEEHGQKLTAHDALHVKHDERLNNLEKEEEEEKVTDEEMKEEVPQQAHDSRLQIRDSSLLHDSYKTTIAGAEVLVPGIQVFSFDRSAPAPETFRKICDQRRQALSLANRNTQDALLIADARGGRQLSDAELTAMNCKQVRDTFTAVVALKRRTNNNTSSSSSAAGTDQPKRKSLSDLNKEAREFYKNRT